MEVTGKELLEYACVRFEEGNYEEALEAFVLTYGKGFEQGWVLENIYRCYMDGNDMEFRKAYEKQAYKLDCGYEACTLDFIPYKEEEYFIFDKERRIFLEKFSVRELRETKQEALFASVEFSAAALEMDWNWGELKNVLVEAKNREIYAICRDMNRAASFCKIPELEEYMDHVRMFPDRRKFQDYFHKHTAVFMPKIIVGKEETRTELESVLNEEHQYRLTPEGRNTENVLLTIGIPTHDRGNLLLKRIENLRRAPYDAEIEIAISKNGTHYYQEEYESVRKIEDARINYEGYNAELGMSKNWQNVIKMAHGKFVMLVSDEDDVILEALEHYLKLLNSHENLGYVRSKTAQQYSFINESKYFLQGKEAFLGGFLQQNYLSGVIYNRELFLASNIEEVARRYKDNSFYLPYPHMWWQVVLAFKGDYAVDAVCLIQEGSSVLFEEMTKYKEDGVQSESLLDEGIVNRGNNGEIPIATGSTYGPRIEQFRGGISLIKEFEEFDENLRACAVYIFARKTLYLMDIVRGDYGYKVEEFPKWVCKLTEEVISATNELMFSIEYQKKILNDYKNFLVGMADVILQ